MRSAQTVQSPPNPDASGSVDVGNALNVRNLSFRLIR